MATLEPLVFESGEKKGEKNVQKHCPALLKIIHVQYFPKINLVV